MRFYDLIVLVAMWVLSLVLLRHLLKQDRHCHCYDYVHLSSYPCPLEEGNTLTLLQNSARVKLVQECRIHRMNSAGRDGRWPVANGEIMAKCLY